MKNYFSRILLTVSCVVCIMVFTKPVNSLASEEQGENKQYMVYTNGTVKEKVQVQRIDEPDILAENVRYYQAQNSNIAKSSTSTIVKSGKCGNSVYYSLDKNGKMVISGSGAMWDFDSTQPNHHVRPWKNDRSKIKSIVFESGVTYVGQDAFCGLPNLTKVKFSDTITNISHFAFWDCPKLGNINLPKNLQALGQQVFSGCTSMTKIIIPSSVSSMFGSCFSNCTNLTYAYIQADPSLEGFLMGPAPFEGCTKLENILVEDGHIALRSINGVLFSNDGKTIYDYPSGKKDKTYVIPSETKDLFMCSFRQSKYLEHLIIPEGVTTIGALVFQYCSQLEEIIIPSTVQEIDEINGESLCKLIYLENKSNTKIVLEEEGPYIVNTLWTNENGKKITSLRKGKAFLHFYIETITAKSQDIAIGKTIDLSKAYTYDSNHEKYVPKKDAPELNFKSSNPKVVEVSEDGIVKAKALGTAKITISCKYRPKNNTNVAENVTITIGVKNDITKASVSKVSTKKYTGKAIKPEVKVTYSGKTLKKDVDYTISYKNNKNIGTATLIVRGKGKYMGTVTKKFKITVSKGKIYTVGNMKYKVTNANSNGSGTVSLVGTTLSKSKLTSLKINNSVTIGGVSFKITAIGDGAFTGFTKLKKISMGNNVTSIGKNAFKNIAKKAIIKVPAKLVNYYKKLIKKSNGGSFIITK